VNFDPDEHRDLIEQHKADRLADPIRRHIFETISQHFAFVYWIEQIGDAELYEDAYRNRASEQGNPSVDGG